MPPSKASSSSTLLNGAISLRVQKFSHCLVTTLKSHMQWIHITGQGDLYAVFESVRKMDVSEQISEKRVLKIVHRGDLLETVELERLRDMAQREGRFRNQLLLSNQEPELSILSRPSQVKIAFRYMTLDRKYRKIQLSLTDGSSYQHFVNELSVYALPIKNMDLEARPATTEPIRSQWMEQSLDQRYPYSNLVSNGSMHQPRIAPRPTITSQYFNANPMEAPGSQNSLVAYQSPHASQESLTYAQQPREVAPTQTFGSSLRQEQHFPRSTLCPPLETRPFSAPETQTPMPFAQNYGESPKLDDLVPPKRTLPWAKASASPATSKRPGVTVEVKSSPKPKRAKKETKPRQRAPPKNKRIRTAQATLTGAVKKPASVANKTVTKGALGGSTNPMPASDDRIESGATKSAKSLANNTTTFGMGPQTKELKTPIPSPMTPAVSTNEDIPQPSRQQPKVKSNPRLAVVRSEQVLQQPLSESTGNAQPTSSRPEQTSQGVQTIAEMRPEDALAQVQILIKQCSNLPASETKDELAKFAAAEEKEQHKIVEKWIIDAVHDENFLKVAKSVEGCYNRIVLEDAMLH